MFSSIDQHYELVHPLQEDNETINHIVLCCRFLKWMLDNQNVQGDQGCSWQVEPISGNEMAPGAELWEKEKDVMEMYHFICSLGGMKGEKQQKFLIKGK